jgi:hypothetical protein
MTKHIGGHAVKAGFYWNLKKWEMVTLSGIGGTLPGGAGDRYLKVPIIAFLFIAPVMGGLYAFFLPFIGFAMLAAFLGRKVGVAGRAAVARVGGHATLIRGADAVRAAVPVFEPQPPALAALSRRVKRGRKNDERTGEAEKKDDDKPEAV